MRRTDTIPRLMVMGILVCSMNNFALKPAGDTIGSIMADWTIDTALGQQPDSVYVNVSGPIPEDTTEKDRELSSETPSSDSVLMANDDVPAKNDSTVLKEATASIDTIRPATEGALPPEDSLLIENDSMDQTPGVEEETFAGLNDSLPLLWPALADTMQSITNDTIQEDTTVIDIGVPGEMILSDSAIVVNDDVAAENDSTLSQENTTSIDTITGTPDRVLSPGDSLLTENDSLLQMVSSNFAVPILPLSLDRAIQFLLRHNPLVISSRLEWLASEHKERAAWGAFEPSITGGYTCRDTRYHYRPYPEQNLEKNLGLKGKLASGTEYTIGYRLTDIRNGRSTFETPQAYSGISATQPLLRGVWFGASMADQKLARMEREIAYQTYRLKIIEMVAEIQDAYWKTAFAQEKFRSALLSVDISRKVVTDSRMRRKTGKMSEMDLMEADAGLAVRLANLADAAQELLDASNQLKLLLSADNRDGIDFIGKDTLLFCTSTIFIDPVDTLSNRLSDTLSTNDLALHPEYLIRRIELDKATVLLGYRKDRCLPELNATASYGINGFGARASTALYRLFNEPQPSWSAQIEVALPILAGVEARNMLTAQKLNRDVAEKNLTAAKYQIVNSYRNIKRRIDALGEHACNAGSVVDFRDRLLEVEFKKLDAGKSNNRLIYETEEKLTEARQWQLESNVRYRMAIMQKAKISGSLLRDIGIETVEDGRPVVSAPDVSDKQ